MSKNRIQSHPSSHVIPGSSHVGGSVNPPVDLEQVPDRLLSDKDVAARYKVEKQTVWRWARSGKNFPKPFKIGGTARWSENELNEHDRKLKEAR